MQRFLSRVAAVVISGAGVLSGSAGGFAQGTSAVQAAPNSLYREAGPADAPVVFLPHGFPTSSHMFRNLIPILADRYRVIAPGYPGFGLSAVPDRADQAFPLIRDFLDRKVAGTSASLKGSAIRIGAR